VTRGAVAPPALADRLVAHWAAQGLQIARGAPEAELARVEARWGLALPDDLRACFARVNGMVQVGGQDVDRAGFAFWALDDVGTLAEVLPRHDVPAPPGLNAHEYVVFADYLQWSWAYAIRLGPAPNPVVMVGGRGDDVVVAPSFSDFVSLYLQDHEALYHPPPSPTTRARRTAGGAVDLRRRFPENVFEGTWTAFRFFDSDWMTSPDFVDDVKALLAIEGATCACIVNLEAEFPATRELFVREQTSADDYRAVLAGTDPGLGWGSALERLGCASEIGEWALYCEPMNEIAVVGFRDADAWQRYAPALARVQAEPFDVASGDPPLSYGFSDRGLTPEWRRLMSARYPAGG
jgi:hypothetical protein